MEDCIRMSRTKLTLGEMLGNERSEVMEGDGRWWDGWEAWHDQGKIKKKEKISQRNYVHSYRIIQYYDHMFLILASVLVFDLTLSYHKYRESGWMNRYIVL